MIFKSNMSKNRRFSEEFLANILSVPQINLHKTATLLSNCGEIIIYGPDDMREYSIEDAYILLTRYTKKEKINILKQFKKEFFCG